MLTYSTGYWEVYRRFQGGFSSGSGEGLWVGGMWENLSMKEVFMGEGAPDFPALF